MPAIDEPDDPTPLSMITEFLRAYRTLNSRQKKGFRDHDVERGDGMADDVRIPRGIVPQFRSAPRYGGAGIRRPDKSGAKSVTRRNAECSRVLTRERSAGFEGSGAAKGLSAVPGIGWAIRVGSLRSG